jgi:MOSC domain-containing protein YiiM
MKVVSVNVGLPQGVAWQGRTVRTAVWKTPVTGRIFAGRLNLDGDGQADLRAHGGEQRALLVYQLESYRYRASYLGRSDLVAGSFGENLTVEGLADNEVCIGDRFGIGGAVVEVSRPRDTCYRVGIRLQHPEIPALLVAHRRPGFYFRVIQEGEIGADDRIEKLCDGPERMTVAEIDALLYSAKHPLEALRRAMRIPALSKDWQGSMQALLDAAEAGGTTGQRWSRARRVGARCMAWLPPCCGRCFARAKRGRPIVRVHRRGRFATTTGATGPTHHGPHEAELGCSRCHAELFAVRPAWGS